MEKHQEEQWGPAQHAAMGAGVGAAGVAQSVAMIGLAGLAVLPVFVVVGALGGLAWWGEIAIRCRHSISRSANNRVQVAALRLREGRKPPAARVKILSPLASRLILLHVLQANNFDRTLKYSADIPARTCI